MRQAGQWLLGLCFALLIFLGAPSLVEGPEAEKHLPTVPMDACLLSAIPANQAEASAVHSRAEGKTRYVAVREQERVTAPVPSPLCESNGWPLKSKPWAKTVYTACPLEDRAG